MVFRVQTFDCRTVSLRNPLLGSGGNNDTAWKPLSNNGGGNGPTTESNGPVTVANSMPWNSSPAICQGPDSVEIFWLELWLEKQLEIPYLILINV